MFAQKDEVTWYKKADTKGKGKGTSKYTVKRPAVRLPASVFPSFLARTVLASFSETKTRRQNQVGHIES